MKREAPVLHVGFLFILSSLPASPPGGEPAPGGEAGTVTVDFRVTAPPGTPPDAAVFLTGSVAALGPWNPSALPLRRRPDCTWEGKLALERGARLEYKLTRGSFLLVEKGKDGEEIPNRVHLAERDQVVEVRVESWASGKLPPPRRSTATGDLRRHELASKVLGGERAVLVWLPPGYTEHVEERYPVLYLHDGQNLFDEATAAFGSEWRADETAGRLIREGSLRPVIIVGIHNTPRRIEEYTPWPDSAGKLGGGKGDLYGRFLVEELKPFIDRSYRTLPGRETTAVGGSSLGGLISLHLVQEHATVFGGCAALSPALWWADRALARAWAGGPERVPRARMWIDMGTREGPPPSSAGRPGAVEDLRDAAKVLEAAGRKQGADLRIEEVPEGEHREADWAARFDRVLVFLFGKGGP